MFTFGHDERRFFYIYIVKNNRARMEDEVAVNVTTGPLADLQQALKEAAEDNEKSQQDSKGEFEKIFKMTSK